MRDVACLAEALRVVHLLTVGAAKGQLGPPSLVIAQVAHALKSQSVWVVTYLSVMFFFKVLAVDYDFAALAASQLAAWSHERSDLLVLLHFIMS